MFKEAAVLVGHRSWRFTGWVLLLVLMFALTRLEFYLFNAEAFDVEDTFALIQLFYKGLRYDLVVIGLLNLPVLLFYFFPAPFVLRKSYDRFLRILFVVVNGLALSLNLVDVILFRYTAKRITSEVYEFFFNTNENNGRLLWQFVTDFWYQWLIFFFIIWLMHRWLKRGLSLDKKASKPHLWSFASFQLLAMLFFAALAVIAGRGGLQLKPVNMLNAAQTVASRNVPLLINSPFSMIKAFGKKPVKPYYAFEEQELERIFNPVKLRQSINRPGIRPLAYKPNFFILILESFGSEYIDFYSQKGRSITPFLDSLLAQSITFNGIANGKRSIEALPSILAGIPSLMDIDYPSSPFSTNRIEGLGTVLKKRGYTTAFFHGGNNGTMGFDAFSRIAGFDHYFGRSEYNNDKDFDGRWGIYDLPFLQYTVGQLNHFPEPFAAALFTLSSHHPYRIPAPFEHSFPQARTPLEATMAYVDYALRQFFELAKKQDWFERTVFVITADHTPEQSQAGDNNYVLGVYSVPLAFYLPGQQMAARMDEYAQHVDILPTLAAACDCNLPVFSFGRNLLDTTDLPYAVNYLNGQHKLIRGNHLLISTDEGPLEWIVLDNDYPTAKPERNSADEAWRFQQAIIQQFRNRMLANRLHP